MTTRNLKKLFLNIDIKSALYWAGGMTQDEPLNICKCLKPGNFSNLEEEQTDFNHSIDHAWRKF